MLWEVTYVVRKRGSIGATETKTLQVHADNEADAREAAFCILQAEGYETFHPEYVKLLD